MKNTADLAVPARDAAEDSSKDTAKDLTAKVSKENQITGGDDIEALELEYLQMQWLQQQLEELEMEQLEKELRDAELEEAILLDELAMADKVSYGDEPPKFDPCAKMYVPQVVAEGSNHILEEPKFEDGGKDQEGGPREKGNDCPVVEEKAEKAKQQPVATPCRTTALPTVASVGSPFVSTEFWIELFRFVQVDFSEVVDFE